MQEHEESPERTKGEGEEHGGGEEQAAGDVRDALSRLYRATQEAELRREIDREHHRSGDGPQPELAPGQGAEQRASLETPRGGESGEGEGEPSLVSPSSAEPVEGAGPGAGEDVDLVDPQFYFNRELSWLQFNWRVLAQARDPSVPLLERLTFLCICSTNLDEFFEVRVGKLTHQIRVGTYSIGPDAMTPHEQLKAISLEAHDFVHEQYRILNDELFPALAEAGIRFLRRTRWTPRQARWVERYFHERVMPVLSPLGLDPAHPFPRLLNKSLNFIVRLEGNDAFGRSSGIAIVQAPRSLPRVIHMPPEISGGESDFVFLSSVMHAHVGSLFPGMRVLGCWQFRVTRNSDLFVDEEEVEDLMLAVEDELWSRHYGDAVRLEVADNCPREVAQFLLDRFDLGADALYQVNGPVNLNRLMTVPDLVDRPDQKYTPFVPRPLGRSTNRTPELLDDLQERDILLHHPFDSFNAVVELLRQAAADPAVLAIKQTVYRTETDSPLTDALYDAARAGKEVLAVIELRARFDEERNIRLANRLQEAGAHVVYGVVGYKTHAKMLLIVRREGTQLRRYVHLGTGNYHPRTSRQYTDFGFMTSDKAIGEDVSRLFQELTGLGTVQPMRKLLHSPFTLHPRMVELIEHERQEALAGRPALIRAKMNSLTEAAIIRALYRASQAGVKIELIVRGVCRLRPGLPGVSETIRVRSIVGRLLEHSRVYYFHHGGEELLYCSSADWMGRNMHRRVGDLLPRRRLGPAPTYRAGELRSLLPGQLQRLGASPRRQLPPRAARRRRRALLRPGRTVAGVHHRGRPVSALRVNGEPLELEPGQKALPITALLERLGIEQRRGVAVAVDGRVVPRSRWAEEAVGEGAEVEIIRAAQGG